MADSGVIVDELTINTKRAYRERMKTIADMAEQAQKANLPFCQTCATLDYQNGRLNKDWKEYTKTRKTLKKYRIVNKKTNEIMGVGIDYECARGHGITVQKAFLFKRDQKQIIEDTAEITDELRVGEKA